MTENSSEKQRSLSRITIYLSLASLVIFIFNVLLTGFDVLLRWLLNSPQSWVSDVASISFPIALACCFPAALEGGHMIAMRFLGERLPLSFAKILDVLGQIGLAIIMSIFSWKMFGRAVSDWSAGYTTANIALPLAPTWVIVSVLLGVSAVLQILVTWRLIWAPLEFDNV